MTNFKFNPRIDADGMLDRARKALHSIPADLPRPDWIRVGMSAKAVGLDFQDFDLWSATGATYKAQDAITAWRSFKTSDGIGPGTLFYYAVQHGWSSKRAMPTWRRQYAHQHPAVASKAKKLTEQDMQWASNRKALLRLWSDSKPLTGACPASLYLVSRGLRMFNTEVLRFTESLDYWYDGKRQGSYPALLSAVTDPSDQLVSVHRTYLNSAGKKAPIPSAKKLTRTSGSLKGATVKLGAPTSRPDGALGLGIAEGIETALSSAQLFRIPVWAGVSAYGLEQFVPPSDVRNVYVFADNDESQTGQDAAARLSERLIRLGLNVRIHIPPVPGDWNDVLQDYLTKTGRGRS